MTQSGHLDSSQSPCSSYGMLLLMNQYLLSIMVLSYELFRAFSDQHQGYKIIVSTLMATLKA